MRSRLAVRSLLRASQLPPARARALGSICRLPAIYSSFPASLFRYSPRQKSSLFDVKELDQRQDDPRDDAVTVSKDGLVHPYRKGQLTSSNAGAILRPNTCIMQELVRTHVDYTMDLEEEGKSVEPPLIYCIPNGTPITSNLILVHESAANFSLQPTQAMPLEELNHSLDEFFAKYAEKMSADQWLDDHPWDESAVDDDYTTWFGK